MDFIDAYPRTVSTGLLLQALTHPSSLYSYKQSCSVSCELLA